MSARRTRRRHSRGVLHCSSSDRVMTEDTITIRWDEEYRSRRTVPDRMLDTMAWLDDATRQDSTRASSSRPACVITPGDAIPATREVCGMQKKQHATAPTLSTYRRRPRNFSPGVENPKGLPMPTPTVPEGVNTRVPPVSCSRHPASTLPRERGWLQGRHRNDEIRVSGDPRGHQVHRPDGAERDSSTLVLGGRGAGQQTREARLLPDTRAEKYRMRSDRGWSLQGYI